MKTGRVALASLAAASWAMSAARAQTPVYDTLHITTDNLYNRSFGDCIGTVPTTPDINDVQLADDFPLTRAALVTRVVADFTATSAAHAPDAVWVQFFANVDATNMPSDTTYAEAVVSGEDAAAIDLGLLTTPAPYNFGVRFSVNLRPSNITLPAGTWWVSIQPVNVQAQDWYWILRQLGTVTGNGEAGRNGGTHHTGTYGGYPGIFPSPDGDSWRRLGDIGFRSGTVPMRIEVGCAADFTNDGLVNVADFLSFLALYAAGDPAGRADFNGDGVINVQDFLAFLASYAAGCT
jgi:hypothetical protein